MTSETGFEQSGTVLRMRTWSVAGSERKQSIKDRTRIFSEFVHFLVQVVDVHGQQDSTSLKLYLSKVSLGSVSHFPLEFV